MSMRVGDGLSTQLNTSTHLSSSAQAADARPVGEQIQQALFRNRVPPPLLDPAKFPELAALLRRLAGFRRKLAAFAGDHEEDYELVLANDTIAMIDEDGKVYLGAGFLTAFKDKEEVLVGALAHEIGHRPKRWKERHYQTKRPLTTQQMQTICRHEETRADIFAGKALAELGLSCEPLLVFLTQSERSPHPEYFPAAVRAQVIRDAHGGRIFRADQRRKLFPSFDRMTSARGHIGEG